MANQEIRLKAEHRMEQGSSAVGRLRRAGSLPAAVNRIEGGTTLVKFDAHGFKAMLRHHTSEHVLVTLELDGKDIPALMREVQYNVMTGYPIHVDFGEVSLTKKLHVQIPVHLLGEPEGVKVEGGILQQMLRMVDVECLPTDIVEHFDVDISHLKLNQSLCVRDLPLGEKYMLITGKDMTVAIVAAPAKEVVVEKEADAVVTVAATAAATVPLDTSSKGKKDEPGATVKAPAKK